MWLFGQDHRTWDSVDSVDSAGPYSPTVTPSKQSRGRENQIGVSQSLPNVYSQDCPKAGRGMSVVLSQPRGQGESQPSEFSLAFQGIPICSEV